VTSFYDADGRSWNFRITVAALMRMQEEGGISLTDDESMQSPVSLTKCMFYTCKPQADKLGISLTDFSEALDGKAFQAAAEAFGEAVQHFAQPGEKKTDPYPPAKSATS
jgi:hypothetical protein